MVELIFSILGVIVLLGVVWGALCMVTGEKNIGNTIMVNCFTAMVLFIILLSLFNLHGAGNGSLNEAVPMLDGLERYGNTSNFLKSNPAEFALNFVQLVTISLLVNYISNLFGNGSSNNIVGKLIGRIVIVMLAFIAYGFVWKMISENVVIKWCIYAVESLITVGAVSYPIMVLAASITGLKTNNYVDICGKTVPQNSFWQVRFSCYYIKYHVLGIVSNPRISIWYCYQYSSGGSGVYEIIWKRNRCSYGNCHTSEIIET